MAKKTTRTTKSPSTTAAKAATADSERVTEARRTAFTSDQPEQAFAHFRPTAEQVPTDDLTPFNGVPLQMLANVRTALSVMDSHWNTVLQSFPTARLREVLELPTLVLGLEFSVTRVPSVKLSTGEIDKLLAEGSPLRELTLTYLEVVSDPMINLVPRERVQAIRKGTGRLDQAQDFVAIAGLFSEYKQVLTDKHPFPHTLLHHLGELGGTLVQQIRPTGTIAEASKRSPESILRDQFGALVTERYDHLLVLATVALGHKKASQSIPALRSVEHSSPQKASTETPK